MNHYQQAVRDFHIALGIPAPDVPTPLPPDRVALRIRLLREEVEEFAEAAQAGDLIATIHELCDVLVVTYGAAVEMGVYIRPFFDEVMAANMRKKGGPARADGKIMKSPLWTPPDLHRVFRETYGVIAL